MRAAPGAPSTPGAPARRIDIVRCSPRCAVGTAMSSPHALSTAAELDHPRRRFLLLELRMMHIERRLLIGIAVRPESVGIEVILQSPLAPILHIGLDPHIVLACPRRRAVR